MWRRCAALIIIRYLIREISKPLGIILGVLIALFASYNAASFLSEAVNGLLPTDTIAALIGLKVLVALEVLIPISLYISVVLSFGRLYSDSEFTAMFALRVTPARVMAAVLTLSAGIALAVAGLSLIARPWAYQAMHEISKRAEVTLDLNAMQAGTFYIGQHGKRVIFLTHRDGPQSAARDVFVQLVNGDRVKIIHAQLAFPLPQATQNGGSQVYMKNAHIYEISRDMGRADQVLNVPEMVLNSNSGTNEPPEYSSVAASSLELARSNSASDIAEFQWRLSTAVSTLLLGMLGVPLSRAMPRQGKYAKFGTAILIYSGYYLLCTSARTWVQHGVTPAFPGIWWVPALLALVLLIAVYGPDFKFRRAQTIRSAGPIVAAPDDPLGDHGPA